MVPLSECLFQTSRTGSSQALRLTALASQFGRSGESCDVRIESSRISASGHRQGWLSDSSSRICRSSIDIALPQVALSKAVAEG